MKKIFIASSLLLLIVSCSKKSENNPVENNAVDKVESSVYTSLKSGRGKGNMVLDIYYELLKNDKKLQDIDQKIKITNEDSESVISKYETIINKSDTYYLDAQSLTRSISDSLLKKNIEKQIQLSYDHYDLKTKKIKDLIVKIIFNKTQIHNQYLAFQIKKTLPEIEKYQNAHPLKTDSLNNFINKQNQLLNELKNMK